MQHRKENAYDGLTLNMFFYFTFLPLITKRRMWARPAMSPHTCGDA